MIRNNVRHIVAIFMILMIFVNTIDFQAQLDKMINRVSKSMIYDKEFINTMNDISKVIPNNTTLVVSAFSPYVTYFTGIHTTIPYERQIEHSIKGNTSADLSDTLKNYMIRNNYTYLLVFENRSNEEKFKRLFSGKGLKGLDNNFQKIDSFSTDFYKIHIYKTRIHKAKVYRSKSNS